MANLVGKFQYEKSAIVFIRFVGTRILCLDGGGSRGIVEAMAIEKLEECLNCQSVATTVKLCQLFDLIAGIWFCMSSL